MCSSHARVRNVVMWFLLACTCSNIIVVCLLTSYIPLCVYGFIPVMEYNMVVCDQYYSGCSFLGPTLPNIPVQPVAMPTSYNTVSIMFSVNNIAYDAEEYYVIYGLSSDNLSYRSSKISGSVDLNSLDEDFVIPLYHLEHNAVYYYRVVANNSHGMVQSAVNTFQTPRVG